MTQIGKPLRQDEYWPLDVPVPKKREEEAPAVAPEKETAPAPEREKEPVTT